MASLQRPAIGRGIYGAICLGVIMLRLHPFSTQPNQWPGPSILLVLTLLYALRQPRLVPPMLVAGVFFLADLLFMKPPGLMAALVVIGSETLRRRSEALRSAGVMAEWIMIAIAIAAITVLERLTLGVLMVPRPELGPALIGMIGSIAIIPVVDLIGRLILGLRRAAHGERDEKGHRI